MTLDYSVRKIRVLALGIELSTQKLIELGREAGMDLSFVSKDIHDGLSTFWHDPPDMSLIHVKPEELDDHMDKISDVSRRYKVPILLLSSYLDRETARWVREMVEDCILSDELREEDVISWISAKRESSIPLSERNQVLINMDIDNPLGHWSVDVSTGKVSMSGSLPSLLGLEEGTGEISLEKFKSLMPEETLKRFLPFLECDGTDCSRTFQMDMEIMHPGQQMLRFTLKGRRLCDSHEDVHRVEGIAFDRFQEKTSPGNLRERDQALKWLVEHGDDLIIMARLQGEITYMNPAMETFLRNVLGGSMNQDLFDILKLEKREDFQVSEATNMFQVSYGKPISKWVQWSISPVPALDGYTLVCRGKDITKEVEADREKALLYDNIANFVSNTPGVMFRCRADAHYTMLSISDDIENLTGYPSSDFINNNVRTFASIIHPEDQHSINHVILEGIEKGKEYVIRYRILAKNGDVVWVQENANPVFDDDGSLSVYGILTDVTEIYDMEEARRQSVDRYRSLFNNMQTGFAEQTLVFDEYGNVEALVYADVNPAFESETGLPRTVIGKSIKEVMPNFEDFWYNAFVEVGLTGKPKQHTNYVKDVDRWFDVFIFSPGKGRVAQIFLDISEQMRLTTRVAESEDKYRGLFNTMPVAFALCEITRVPEGKTDFTLLEMNPSMRELSERAGNPTDKIPHRWSWIPRWSTVIDTQMPLDFEDRLPESDIWVHVLSFPVSGGRFAVFINDITERVMMENSLKSAYDEKSLLLQELNHRVGNNLQMMMSMLQLQIMKMKDKDGTAPLIMTQNRLTAMARAYQHIYSTGPGEAIELGRFVRNLADDILDNIPGGGHFELRIEDLKINVTLESLVYISFILNELISNSAVHALKGRESGRIDIGLNTDEDGLHIRYGDDGPGLSDLDALREDPECIGMRMVITMLERQLGGSIMLRTDPWSLEIVIGNLRRQTWAPLS